MAAVTRPDMEIIHDDEEDDNDDDNDDENDDENDDGSVWTLQHQGQIC